MHRTTIRSRITTLAGVAAIASAAMAVPALAGGKERVVVDRFTESYAGSVDCSEFGPYTFSNEYSGVEKVRVTDVLSRDGDLLRTVVHLTASETQTNSQTGAQLPLKVAVQEVWDYTDETRTISGKVWLGTRAGGGTYVQDTGRIVLTFEDNEPLVVSGPHEAFFAGGVDEPVCAALDAAP